MIKMSIPMDHPLNSRWLIPIYELIVNFFCLSISFVLVILIIKRMLRKGTSKRLRKIISIRYVLAFVVFLHQYAVQILKSIDAVMDPEREVTFSQRMIP